jgi:antitoxin component of MazEF toxin-antitoxin module
MGYLVKMQKVERPTNQSFYLNFPSALAQSLNIVKGESFEWLVENKNLIVLRRIDQKAPIRLRKILTRSRLVGKG